MWRQRLLSLSRPHMIGFRRIQLVGCCEMLRSCSEWPMSHGADRSASADQEVVALRALLHCSRIHVLCITVPLGMA